MVHLLEPFRCRVLGNDVEDRHAWCEAAEVLPATKADDLDATADVVTLHVPLTADTHHLIDAAALARFRTDAVLINASRGPVVDRAPSATRSSPVGSVARRSTCGRSEPATDAALLALPNVIGTPHIGGRVEEAVVAMGRAAIGHLVDHFEAAREVREERVPA